MRAASALLCLRALVCAALLAGCAPLVPQEAKTSSAADDRAPEAPSGWGTQSDRFSQRQAVASAHVLASQAGLDMLRAGGSAMDAAVAAQAVLGLVEPQSSGIGGGGFLLYHDGRSTHAFDGREVAPAGIDENLFLQADGQPMPFHSAAVGGRAVGVPGVMRMLEQAHRLHGRLPWARLFEPAISLADEGFPVGARLHQLLSLEPHLKKDPVAAAYFYDAQGRPWPVGHRLRNPEYARVMRAIAQGGASALHQGPIAQAMVTAVQQHPSNPGKLSLADLQDYQSRLRQPICFDHTASSRQWRICGMPPPSSGALAVGQILGLLERTPAGQRPLQQGRPDVDWLHGYSEAARLAFADRALYVADPDFADAPGGTWQSLLAPGYLQQRARLIGARSLGQAAAGQPGKDPGARRGLAPMANQPEYGTTHLSVIDAQGHALALTSSIEDAFGARLMVNTGQGLAGGFLLNNQLTDFSFVPRSSEGLPVANRPEPGKRPRSSMSPTLVFEAGSQRPHMSLGSPGGAYIIHYTAQALWASLHWGLKPQAAIALPHLANMNGPLLLEQGRYDSATAQALAERGTVVRQVPMTSGLQILQRSELGWLGASDARREGRVLGD
ncbi:MAG: gamma-glutamyltransferase family protein [Betaproteobacteria bacterium]